MYLILIIGCLNFTVDLRDINEKEIEFTKLLLINLCIQIKKYLPIYDKTFECLSILDPKSRYLPNTLSLFRKILNLWRRCYDPADYNKLTIEFQVFMKHNCEQLTLALFENSQNFEVEKFWISILKNNIRVWWS